MWIRYKDWEKLSSQEQVRVYTHNNQRFEFWKIAYGLCDIRNLSVINAILGNRYDGRSSEYEVAWEKLGVHFDLDGNQLESQEGEVPLNGDDSSDSAEGAESIDIPIKKKRGRPRKIRADSD